MSDIVERLRDPTPPHHGKCLAAAAEIERLRKRLELREPDWPEEADGIACRDDTIALLDDRVARQATDITRLRAHCEAMVAALETAERQIGAAFRAIYPGDDAVREGALENVRAPVRAYRAAYPEEGREDE